MAMDESLLKFIENIVHTPGEAPLQCSNWSETGRSLVSSFVVSLQPDAIYVIVQCDTFQIVSDLLHASSDFELLVVMIKQTGALSDTLPLMAQIHVINIPGNKQSLEQDGSEHIDIDIDGQKGEVIDKGRQKDSYGQIMNLISLAITPYFNLVAQKEVTDTSSGSLSVAKKKFGELALSLRHLQHRIQVPELLTAVPQHIRLILADPESPQDASIVSDSELLNNLTKIVNSWIQQIQAVTNMSQNISEGNTIQDEVQFWAILEATLTSLREQTLQPEVKCAIDILNAAKRFQVTLSFQNNLGISESLEETRSYNDLLKDLPIAELMISKDTTREGTKDIESLESTISTLFSHLKKWKGSNSLSLKRMIALVELLVEEVAHNISTILVSLDLVGIMYPKFCAICADHLSRLFHTIDNNVKFMVNIIRELMRKRKEKFMVIKIETPHLRMIIDRLENLRSLRKKHEDLLQALTCLDGADNQTNKITLAYSKQIAPSSPFDFSKQGISLWETNQQLYTDAFLKVSENTSVIINRKFEQSGTFIEYLCLFDKLSGNSGEASSTFILSFVDDRHKLDILDVASADIDNLISLSYTRARTVSSVDSDSSAYDLISWELSFKAKSDFYIASLQKLLGENWNNYSVGSKIESKLASYHQKANIDDHLHSWVESATSVTKNPNTTGNVLRIDRSAGDDLPCLIVDYESRMGSFLREKEDLLNYGFEIPSTLRGQLDRHKSIQPVVFSLYEHIGLLEDIILGVCNESEYGVKFGFLIEEQKQNILALLQDVSKLSWSSVISDVNLQKSGDSFVEAMKAENSGLKLIGLLQDSIYKLHFQMNAIHKLYERLYSHHIPELSSCEYSSKEVAKVILGIQEDVNPIVRGDFCNLEKFVAIVNRDIADAIAEKCLTELVSFSSVISGRPPTEAEVERFTPRTHSIKFDNGSFSVHPPLETSKSVWVEHVNKTLQLTENVILISASGGVEYHGFGTSAKLSSTIIKVMSTVERSHLVACEYVSKWIAIQRLFSEEERLEDLYFPPEASAKTCLKTVDDILKLKSICGHQNGYFRVNGVMNISFVGIESQVLKRFATIEDKSLQILVSRSQRMSKECSDDLTIAQRSLLKDANFEGTTHSVLASVAETYSIKIKLHRWSTHIEDLSHCQSYLYRLNVPVTAGWVHVEQLEGQESNVRSLLSKRLDHITANFDSLALKLRTEWSGVQDASRVLGEDWRKNKPISAGLEPPAALATIANFKSKVKGLHIQIKSLLEIAVSMELDFEAKETLELLEEDIEELKVVWTTIQDLWDNLEGIKKQRWSEVHVRGVKHQLEGIIAECRDCPIAVRQYSAFTSLQSVIKDCLRKVPLLSELKSDAMKDRHWEQIFTLVGSKHEGSEPIMVRDVMEINFQMNESVIRNILEKANGEQLVQESLDNIRDEWTRITFETFSHAGKCRLIKNWSFLFEQCATNLGTLASIKHSMFHGEFERERDELESKLNDLTNLLNIWIDVQRQWVYLDGVFGSNSEIKASLPLESSRFSNISFEFLSLLKKVSTFNLVIDVLSIKVLPKTMTKLSDSLTKTVKGLTDFLDKQRDDFPRFFFIGNEDLLELLGSGNNEVQINKHIKRMFPGIATVLLNEEKTQILKIASPQEEVIELDTPVSLIKYRSLSQWLSVLETEIKLTVSTKICQAVEKVERVCLDSAPLNEEHIRMMIDEVPHQVLIVAFQVHFTSRTQHALSAGTLSSRSDFYASLMSTLATLVSKSEEPIFLSKVRCLIIECLHQREVIENLTDADSSQRVSIWNSEQLFYCYPGDRDPLKRLRVKQGRFEFSYGFEYLGIVERLAITPLVNKCFLAMTSALAQKLGGSPFGPAGTGKTECVKALGHNLGRMVLVFCCDDSFDFQSMGRILLGICKVGCWGCFDEFNRLEQKILSSLSTQIERIETSLQTSEKVAVSEKSITVNPETGIFVTMNPDYVGRNELPENLKKLFRGFVMNQPDKERITEVLLTSYGFTCSGELSKQLNPLFSRLSSSMSSQSHYDFGLRALKSILKKAGEIKKASTIEEHGTDLPSFESSILSKALVETIGPKLVRHDESVFDEILLEYGLRANYRSAEDDKFLVQLDKHAMLEGLELTAEFQRKALQVFQIQQAHHGFMLVGSSGSGKSTVIDSVLNTLHELEGEPFQKFMIDGKVLTKEYLYGMLDPITRDWTDGLLTKIIRNISANMKGELERRTWIVFDGDIDPEWAENLNSLLDDNKLLTLPNGERLELPPNVRIVFEVSNLDFATPATVSRCAMIWLDSSLVTVSSLWNRNIHLLRQSSDEAIEVQNWIERTKSQKTVEEIAEILVNLHLGPLVDKTFEFASGLSHIMEVGRHRMMNGVFVYLKTHISEFIGSVTSDSMTAPLKTFVLKALALSFIWALSGDCSLDDKEVLRQFIDKKDPFSELDLPKSLSQCKISYPDLEWDTWANHVELIDLEPHHVLDPGTIVPTVDTVMHESLIRGIINKHSPLILCGPPGSGKTMTFLKALRSSADLELISLNFSKDTTPEALLSTLEQHCEYKLTNRGLELSPKIDGKWAVVFCDEINLPSVDKFGTQRVISFIRQLVERSGFWRPSDLSWVTVRNIQFVGACNDPNDPGRNKLTERLMRHVTLVMVDYPGPQSLWQIYSTFNKASLKCAPSIRQFSDALTSSMIEVYDTTRSFLTADKQSHYIYSPRELTRWCRGILETLMDVSYSSLSELIRLWYHEGLRLFYDRLVNDEERVWCKDLFWSIAEKRFPNSNLETTLKGPVLYSTWLTGQYESVSEEALATFVKERLRVFSEEEMEYDLILFEDMLDHALRIDRVLRQHQGHMILVGPSTSGKTSLTKFVTWMNGMKLIQLKVHSNFTITEFESSLRDVLTCCARGEQVCYLIDESSILEASFIERMNSLLANSEIPGLFEGENLDNLIKLCASEASARGLILDTADEIYVWFTNQISENLHVAFTMSEVQSEKTPQINSSPALFNRCVMSWMGDWSNSSLKRIAESLIDSVPLDQSNFAVPPEFISFLGSQVSSFREMVVDSFVYVHRSNSRASASVVPRQFLNFVELFTKMFVKGQHNLEENQRHTNVGLDKLRETVLEVSQMKKVLSDKKQNLQIKDDDARKMLNKMIVDQNESERKREFSVATKAELEKQEAEIESRRAIVMKDLELAEPAVLEAQRGVQNIKKQHLTELRSMSNPPAAIKMAMESVCILLGYRVSTWRDVQLVVRRDDFIANIVSFDTEKQLSPELRSYMEEVYLSRPDYNYETIHRASKACGPLLQWVIAQIRYSEILVKIGPLREQVQALEGYAMKSKAQLIAIADMIRELEESIEIYKNEYSEVIREAEKIKAEMADIEQKVTRSLKLIENLTKERQRWHESTKDFQQERERLIGNSILGSAFSTYCGNLNQKQRQDLIALWRGRLEKSHIKFDKSMTLASLLATNAEKILWSKSGLPDDDLFIENFAIKNRSEFPLIIDPTGDIIQVLKESLSKKLIVTSFLSDSFTKTVEDALRFGGTVLIQNSELYNPIMDSVLRKDVSHMGGRRVVQFGSKNLILSEQFELILYTRDSRIPASSFLRSRAALLNFTITKSNLENRVLNVSLEHFNPDLEKKRVELEALQSEYNYRLLHLRKSLLSTLNNITGTFLDNDQVIDSLEKMEVESLNIEGKMAESEMVMTSVNEVRQHFHEIAAHSKNIFEIVRYLSETNRFYNFSFAGFIAIFRRVLLQIADSSKLEQIVMKLYDMIYHFFSPTLRKFDKLLFQMVLVVSYHSIKFGPNVKIALLGLLQKCACECDNQLLFSVMEVLLTEEDHENLLENWEEICERHEEEQGFPVVSAFANDLFGIQGPKNIHSAIESYCGTVFGEGFSNEIQIDYWIQNINGPYIFSTSENYDVTFQIKESAKQANTKLIKVSMGSKEGIKAATDALEFAMNEGSWVLIQNIQMSSLWLTHLTGILQTKTPRDEFKLFLTCSLNAESIPSELIDKSSVFTVEIQPRWKTILHDTFNSLVNAATSLPEMQVYFLLSWYHTTIQERLKYVPISFQRHYDINESEVISAAFTIRQMFDDMKSKLRIGNGISWTEIAYRVGEITYGGKIPNEEDSHYCIELARSLFCVESQQSGFNLIDNVVARKSKSSLLPPDASSMAEYNDWIEGLPEVVPLEWLGLEGGVSKEAREEEAKIVCVRASELLQEAI